MKRFKNRVMSLCLAMVMMAFVLSSMSLNAQEDEHISDNDQWYETSIEFELTSKGWIVRSICEEIPGDACNMPGSIHRFFVDRLSPI